MKIITRKCVVTGKVYPIEQLIRFVLKKDGNIYLEKNIKIHGRGAYCLKNEEAIEELFKKRRLNKSFKTNISHNIYDQLRKEVEEYVKEQ